MAQWADCNLRPLISELKYHEKFEEKTDSLILELRQKGLLHENMEGSTINERAETLAAYLNRECTDESFHNSLLEVLETFPAFKDMAVKYRTTTDNGTLRHMIEESLGDPVLKSKEERMPELFNQVGKKMEEFYEASAGTSGSCSQEESQETIDSLNTKIDALTKELDELHLQKNHEVQRAEHAERLLKQQEREYQIEKSASQNHIGDLRKRINELEFELDEAQEKLQLKEDILKEAREKVAHLQMRVNELELQKEKNSSQATSPFLQLKLFCKDVKPTGKKPLGSGCYGSVIEVEYNSAIYAAKKFRGDLELEIRNFEKKLNTEFGILLQLEHDHIVRYIGFTILQDSELPVLLLEKLAKSLHAYLQSESECEHIIPLAQKVHILLGVGKGLIYLHEKGVFHRDLTARNVLLDQSNPPIPKIADFGNSHITNINPIYERDSSVGFPGTLLYMPPEACSHAGRSSPKLDIFSFGHLSLFVCTQTFPCNLLPEKYVHTHEGGRKKWFARSEVERREKYFRMIYDEQYHPLRVLMRKCLDDIPVERPSAGGVVCELEKIRVSPKLSDDVDSPDYVDSPDDGNAPAKNEYQLQGSDNSSLGIR